MKEITVAVRGKTIVILSAQSANGPVALPTVTTASDKAPSAHGQNTAPKQRLRLDVQVSSDVENELAAMIRKLEPTEQRMSGDKVDWTTHLLTLARSLKQQVRDAHETLPPPTHTQSIEGSKAFLTGIRRLLGREV